MRIVIAVLLACLAQVTAFAAAAEPAQAPLRFGGEAQIGTEPPFRVHVELVPDGQKVSGTFSTEDMVVPFAGTRSGDVVTGSLGGTEAIGDAVVRLSAAGAVGEFTLGTQKGTLRLDPTPRDAGAYHRPPQSTDLTAQQWQEDLDALVQILTSKHGNAFHHTPRAAFMREVTRVRGLLGRSTGIENALHLRRLGALVGDGHTDVAFVRGGPFLPIETFWFEDGLRIVAAPAEHSQLLGGRIVSVGGLPVNTVLERLKQFIGQVETDWGYRGAAPYLLSRTDLLEAVGAARGREVAIAVRGADGRHRNVTLTAAGGRSSKVRLGEGAPLWQRRPDDGFWHETLPDGSVYINWRSYEDLGSRSAELLAQLDKQRPRRLIIDLRDNTGGDFNVGRAFVSEIAKRPWLNRKGILYVLTGRITFSAAMTNAVDFKTRTQATLVGEPAGARPNGWQEVRRDFLPNSGLAVSVSTRNYEFLPGHKIVQPDIHLPPTVRDWSATLDGAVEAILKL